jgi:hypothetical protein
MSELFPDNPPASPIPAMDSPPDRQSPNVAQLAKPDRNWSRMQPVNITASKERLDAEHQLVTLRNSTDRTPTFDGRTHPQVHVVLDRGMHGITLQPGESRADVDMLVSDIKYFLSERLPRFDFMGELKPLMPIEIVGFDPAKTLRGDQQPIDQRSAEKRRPTA